MINVDFIRQHVEILDKDSSKEILDDARRENRCMWNMGEESVCDGEFHSRPMFNGYLSVLACDKHLSEHIIVMALRASGLDIESEVLAIDDRASKFKEIYSTDTIDRQWCEDVLINNKKHNKDTLKSLSDEELAITCIESLGI